MTYGFEVKQTAQLPKGHKPVLAIVIDTEEEFDWSAPFSRNQVATASISAQEIAHRRVFDQFGIVPTYVIDWPVATTKAAYTTLKALMNEGRCEIGTHLHPWVSPPHVEEVSARNSYTGNLPPDLELEKLRRLTLAIQENFGHCPRVFKAGRYGLGAGTASALNKLGYLVDTSIVPHTSFSADGGPDFTSYGNGPFWFGPREAPVLELPVTTAFCGWLRHRGGALYPALMAPMARKLRLGGVAARSGALERIRLTPEGGSAGDMIRLANTLIGSGNRVFALTYHSPSLSPGNTPYVRSQQDLETFLADITEFCKFFRDELGGVFLSSSKIRDLMIEHAP